MIRTTWVPSILHVVFLGILLLTGGAVAPLPGQAPLFGQTPPAGQTAPSGAEGYVAPTDPLVLDKLEDWQDRKFGLLMHWGLYAQLGIVESWALCSEDQPFQDRGGVPYEEFKEMYFGLIETFDPRQFDPDPWAEAAWDAGMRYVVFTTKHHDGFSMWDTDETEFRITGPESPFRDHPRSNVAKEVFQAFREKGFMTGAYFSKADWHHPDYWSPLWATPDRNNNYDTGKYPEKWQSFRDFTFRQVEELMTTMGPMDILWLDGGWVRPDSTINDEVRSWGFDIARWEQDIDMPRIAQMARGHQPGLIIVDRTVHGPYEDYRTPEQRVPDTLLPYPWETNLTMTQSWGHTFNPNYKSAGELIRTLIEVVSKGGNFLLNVAPTPEGTFEPEAYERLAEIGSWMEVNGEAIYGSRPVQRGSVGTNPRAAGTQLRGAATKLDGAGPGLQATGTMLQVPAPQLRGAGPPPQAAEENLRFTRSKSGDRVYIFALEWPGAVLEVEGLSVKKGSEVTLLGLGRSLPWSREGDRVRIQLPPELEGRSDHPLVFRVEGRF